MTERRISPLESRICDRLEELAMQIEESKKERNEQVERFFSWIDEQNKHCRNVHSKLDISFTELKTDYENTKEIVHSRNKNQTEFKSRLAISLIAILTSALFSSCTFLFQKIMEK